MEVLLEKQEWAQVNEDEQENRRLVMEGYYQAIEGRTKDFYSVCDRLTEKYLNAAI